MVKQYKVSEAKQIKSWIVFVGVCIAPSFFYIYRCICIVVVFVQRWHPLIVFWLEYSSHFSKIVTGLPIIYIYIYTKKQKCFNETKNKNTTLRTILKLKTQIVERVKIDTPNTQIHDKIDTPNTQIHDHFPGLVQTLW